MFNEKALEEKIQNALNIAWTYAQCNDAHHKAWVIDQMVKALLGNEEDYQRWVDKYSTPTDDGYYEWDTGIAP